MKKLTEGTPIKLILLFAIPLFFGSIFQLFYSLVDTRIVGSTLGETALAGVGATTPLSDFFMSFLNGCTNGFAIIVATYFGAKDESNMKKAIAGTFLLGLSFSLVISIFSLLFLDPLLGFLNIDAELYPIAKDYIKVVLAGLIAATLYNVCAAVLRAVGDSFTPLIFLIAATILNIGLDYLFILTFHMEVAGAAYATVISQMLSAIACLIYMYVKYPMLRLKKDDFKVSKKLIHKLLPTGLSMAFMMSFVNFGTLALQTSINTFHTFTIVAHTAARKCTSIFMLPFSVLGSTLATFCGQNLGAKLYSRIKTGLIHTLLLTFGWCVLVIVAANTISPVLVKMITGSNEQEILETASLYLIINTAFYFVPAAICLLRNAMQGFGDSKTPVFSSSLELIGKILIAYFLAPKMGYMGIIIAEPIVWVIMVIPLIIGTLKNPIFKDSQSANQ
ncbi:MAG: MATE family efflux transporter [Lachnospiraceae bacterium]|nr:MATE family efflux transporter [Lachnospiraceae bacterium]MBQ9122043.1 MATE family efflux transporter [Lachnospiraceae bacterium]